MYCNCVESRLQLLVLTQALNVYGTLHLEALYFRRLVELLTATELLDNAGLLKFSLEFLKGSFDVFALFYGYYNHVAFCFIILLLLLSIIVCVFYHAMFWVTYCIVFLVVFTSFTFF